MHVYRIEGSRKKVFNTTDCIAKQKEVYFTTFYWFAMHL
jgi:hypothetical protein